MYHISDIRFNPWPNDIITSVWSVYRIHSWKIFWSSGQLGDKSVYSLTLSHRYFRLRSLNIYEWAIERVLCTHSCHLIILNSSASIQVCRKNTKRMCHVYCNTMCIIRGWVGARHGHNRCLRWRECGCEEISVGSWGQQNAYSHHRDNLLLGRLGSKWKKNTCANIVEGIKASSSKACVMINHRST